MHSLQPWNNIPKINNSKIIRFNNQEFFEFDTKTTYLPRGLGRSYGDVCLNNDGSLIETEDWGLRDISFNINNFKKAFYKFYQIEINGNKLIEIKKNLTQNEKILRHLFVKVEEHQKLPTKMINEEK